jgi:hypothetical protein
MTLKDLKKSASQVVRPWQMAKHCSVNNLWWRYSTSKTDTDFPRSRETDKTWRKEKLGQKSQGLFPAESLVWRIDYEAMGVRWMGKRIFTNPLSTGSSGKILVADVHMAQQTDAVKRLLVNKKLFLLTCLQDVPVVYSHSMSQ